MTAPGQLDLEGNETIDPRHEAAAKALWWADAKRTWWEPKDCEHHAKEIWPRVRSMYLATARVAINAADAA